MKLKQWPRSKPFLPGRNYMLFMLVGSIILLMFTFVPHQRMLSRLIHITRSTALHLDVSLALNDHGSLILNKTHSINTSTPVVKSQGKQSYKTIYDIEEPYFLKKERDNDTLIIIKDTDTLILTILPPSPDTDVYHLFPFLPFPLRY